VMRGAWLAARQLWSGLRVGCTLWNGA